MLNVTAEVCAHSYLVFSVLAFTQSAEITAAPSSTECFCCVDFSCSE